MARLPRFNLPGVAQHIIQRGNNRQVCFAAEEDFSAYASCLSEYSKKFDVSIHAWFFMTNHAHFLATPETPDGVSKMMQALGRRYVQYFNYQYRRSGTLWEGRFKSCLVQNEEYLLKCYRYIELNPVRACMVESPDEYKWSSYGYNAYAKFMSLATPHPVYLNLGTSKEQRANAYRALFKGHLDPMFVNQVRKITNQGMVLGNDRFREEVESLSGRRATPIQAGRPKVDG